MTIVDEYSKRYPPSASSKRCEPALLLPLSTIEFYLRIIKALGDPIPAAIKYSESCKKKNKWKNWFDDVGRRTKLTTFKRKIQTLLAKPHSRNQSLHLSFYGRTILDADNCRKNIIFPCLH